MGCATTTTSGVAYAAVAPDSAGRLSTSLPFRELYRSVYAAAVAGGPPSAPDHPFADGHRANVLGDAIALSNAETTMDGGA
jgi:hypothetical protein